MGMYKIVYRDAAGNDRRAFTNFEDKSTIEENLAHIVPKAVEKGLLHPEATVQNVLVEHAGVRLNTKLPIRQAAPGIKDHDDIVVRYIASQISLRMRIVADDPADQRKVVFGRRKTIKIKETVAVDPSEQLMGQIEGKLNEFRSSHKFYGKELKNVKKFELRTPERKIQPYMSLAEQGFETDLEVKIKPRTWFDWPPCFFYGLRGPYTGHAITLGVVLAIVAITWFGCQGTDVDWFLVSFEAPIECNVRIDDAADIAPLVDGIPVDSIPAGEHVITIYPRERPIQRDTIQFHKKVRGKIGESDRKWNVQLHVAVPDSTISERTTPVRIVGYEGASSIDDNIRLPLILNGFKYPLNENELDWKFELVPGDYEIRFSNLPDEQLLTSEPSESEVSKGGDFTFESGVLKKGDFTFAVVDSMETRIVFRYDTKAEGEDQ